MEVPKSGQWTVDSRLQTNKKKKNRLKKQTTKALHLVIATSLVLAMLSQSVLALTANVRIEGPSNQTIFSGDVDVPKTVNVTDSSGNNHQINEYQEINALVAASDEGSFPFQVTDWGFGIGLDSINGISDPFWSKYWHHRINWASSLGLNSPVSDGDEILFHYTGYDPVTYAVEIPLLLEVSKTNVGENEDVEIASYYYDEALDEFFSTKSTVTIDDQIFETDENGFLTVYFTNPGEYNIFSTKPGHVKSNEAFVTVNKVEQDQKQNDDNQNYPGENEKNNNENQNNSKDNNSGPGKNKQENKNNNSSIVRREDKDSSKQSKKRDSNTPDTSSYVTGMNISKSKINSTIRSSIQYLRKKQSKNGAIENPAVSAWAALAFAAADVNPYQVKRGKKTQSLMHYLENYSQKNLSRKWLKKNPNETKPLVTDYSRQIMAIYAAGRNPRNFGGLNHVNELNRFFKNNQFGEKHLINDDIFAVIAYKAVKANPNDPRLVKALQFILRNQRADGGFGYNANPAGASDVDTTAAAIQALLLSRRTKKIANLNTAIEKAYNYLISKMNSDGGFQYNNTFTKSNSQSSSWASQAIMGVKGKGQFNKIAAQGKNNPLYYLSTTQKSNGGFAQNASSNATAWATASVIPALAKKPWLIRYKQPFSINANAKHIKANGKLRIFGKRNRAIKGTLILRYKNNNNKWQTLKKAKLSGKKYNLSILIKNPGIHVFSVKLGSLKSRQMKIFAK